MLLLERESQLQELQNHLKHVTDGHGRVVFIGGEAGVGKSSLVDGFCQRVSSIRVLKSTFDSPSTPEPLGPLIDLGPALGLDVEQLLDPSQLRFATFHAVLAALQSLDEPIIIVGEDAHWSDEASIDLLRFVSRRIGNVKLLLLITYRNDELGPTHPLRQLLGDLATDANVHRLSVLPLSTEAVKSLAVGTNRDPGELFRRTGGNPFYISEVLASDEVGVPELVTDAVLARAARLSPEARSILELCAVIGLTADSELVLSLIGQQVMALDECVSRGFLRPHPDGLAFRHDLVRDAILSSISGPRRQILNRQVLTELLNTQQSTDFARLAHYAEAAGAVAELRSFATAAANQAAALKSRREEAAQYARLLRFSGDLPDDKRAALLEKYSFACYLSNQSDEGIQARRQAIEFWQRSGNSLKAGGNLQWISRMLLFQGRDSEAEQTVIRALEILEQLPPGPELAMAFSTRAHIEMLKFNTVETMRWGEKALELAERFDELETQVHAMINVGSVRGAAGDAEGIRMLERAYELANGSDMVDHAARALINVAETKSLWFSLREAVPAYENALRYTADHDLDFMYWYLMASRAVVRLYLGEWDAALRDVDRTLSASSVSPNTRIMSLTVRGSILARRGEPGSASALDEALDLARKSGQIQRLAPVRLARADAAWLEGERCRAIAEARATEPLVQRFGTPWMRGELAYVLLRDGEVFESDAEMAKPFALMIAGRWGQAAEEWRTVGCVYEQACALSHAGDEASIRAALDIFSSLKAVPMERWTRRRLRAIGAHLSTRGPRASTRNNPAGLTRRQMDVLRLLAEGLTNDEIADRLFIAPKTAEHHVSAILSKLGAETRTAAAKRARQIGLLS